MEQFRQEGGKRRRLKERLMRGGVEEERKDRSSKDKERGNYS